MLSTVKSGQAVNTDTIFVASWGVALQAVVSDPCFLKWISSPENGLSELSPVLHLCASLRKIPLVRFR